jgi:hypothetical protein
MTTEWTELKDLQAVAKAQAEKWEIEVLFSAGWAMWDGTLWSISRKYRGRPAQPKTRTVTSECWRHKTDGRLVWGDSNCNATNQGWQRFPCGDRTGEVEE